MKKFFVGIMVVAIFALGAADAFSSGWTEYENSLVLGAMQIRLDSRSQKDQKTSLEWLEKKRAEFLSSIKKGEASEEALLAVENVFVCEQYHYVWELDSKAKATGDLILSQFNKVMEWNQSHPLEKRGEWYTLTACEVINNAMPWFKYSKRISLGMDNKKIYESMLASGCKKGLLYLHTGLWYAFAPAIGGGSNDKAKRYFAVAPHLGPSDYEKFFGYVFLSQIELKMGDKASCQAHLAEADKISPNNIYTNFVRYLNKAGCTSFDYATDRDDVEEKVKKYYANAKK